VVVDVMSSLSLGSVSASPSSLSSSSLSDFAIYVSSIGVIEREEGSNV
jgi:hypothetical protein